MDSERERKKLIMRARLIASGVIRYWQYDKSKEVHQWCAIMAEELAKIEDAAVVLNIRENLLRYGLHVPKLQSPTRFDSLDDAGAATGSGSIKDQHEPESPPQLSAFLYDRRTNNQVSEYLEAGIRDLLKRGLSKSAVARALRVNRRVVIRVAREAQSAQRSPNGNPNDLGTSTEKR